MRALLLAAALFAAAPAAAPAAAQAPAQAPAANRLTLADAANAPSGRVIIDGATWRCDGAACTSSGGVRQPALRACRRVVARLGKVTAFTWRGVALDEAQLAACNA